MGIRVGEFRLHETQAAAAMSYRGFGAAPDPSGAPEAHDILAKPPENRRPKPRQSTAGKRTQTDAGFDSWLDRTFHKLYDPVLDEAIPDELAELLNRFESKNDKKGPSGSSDDDVPN